MTPEPTPAAERLRTTLGRVALAATPDGVLVRRFADHRDDLAFAELVHRFAPAVYALCRRHLTDPGAIDDAFQAVFVLLARKAASLAHPDRVGGWLVGTADRVARTARRRHLRRSDKLRPLESVPEPAAEPPPPTDLRTVLDDELAKLPPHYREVVLLCDVQGVARRAAAAQLGLPTGTLSNRLTRARAVLGRRLLRRGVLVSAGGLVSSGSLTSAPPRLIALAVRAALADSPPTELLPLLVPVVTPMVRAKQLLAVAVGLATLGGMVTGLVLLNGPTPPSTTNGEQAKSTTAATTTDVAARPQPKPRLPQDDTYVYAFSPDGRWFARAPGEFGADTKLSLFDTTTWKEVAIIGSKELGNFVGDVVVSADGKRVFVSTGRNQGHFRVWDLTAGKFEEKRFELSDGMLGTLRTKLSPDGRSLVVFTAVTAESWSFRVADASTGDILRTIDLPQAMNARFKFTDGGKTVAAIFVTDIHRDRKYWVGEWDLATGEEKRRIELGKVIGADRDQPIATSVAYTADGKQLVVGGGYRLPDVPAEKMNQQQYIVNTFPWAGSVWVIDRDTGRLAKTLIDYRHDLIRSLHITPNGKKLIVRPELQSRWSRGFGPDNEFVELQQWDVTTWELDWVKIVPAAEKWKLWNGAAK